MKINSKNRGVINHVKISPFYSKFVRVQGVKDGVLCPSYQFQEYSAKEKIQSLEFSLGNLIAIGATDSLQYVSLSVNSDMNFVDNFATSYNKLQSDVSQVNQ